MLVKSSYVLTNHAEPVFDSSDVGHHRRVRDVRLPGRERVKHGLVFASGPLLSVGLRAASPHPRPVRWRGEALYQRCEHGVTGDRADVPVEFDVEREDLFWSFGPARRVD